MPNGEPAPGDGQTEAADTVDSVKDSANPESAEADVEVEEQGQVDVVVDAGAGADADAVGSTKDWTVPEEGGAEEVGVEHKGDALVDAAATTIASLDDLGKVEAQGAEEEVEERLGDALVGISVAHQVKSEAQGNEVAEGEAQGNEVAETKGEAQGEERAEMKDDTQGNEAAEMDVHKAGNGDEHTEVRVDGDKGSLLKEERDNGGDNKKDAIGEDELVPALAGKDENHNLSDKVLNNSFMFDYTRGCDDSGTEEEQTEFIKELDRFYTMKLMEFKPPKFYGEGLNCLKLWRQVTGLGGYDQ